MYVAFVGGSCIVEILRGAAGFRQRISLYRASLFAIWNVELMLEECEGASRAGRRRAEALVDPPTEVSQ